MASKGEVWLWYDADSNKVRPGVIVGTRKFATDDDIVLAKITGYVGRNEFDIDLKYWKEYGLKNPSTVRCSKLYTIKERDLRVKVANIDLELDRIKLTIAKYIME